MPTLRPDRMYSSVTDITYAQLSEMGVRGLLLDIDGTLMPTKTDRPTPDVLRWLCEMKDAGIALFILSNSRRPGRVERLSRSLNIPGFIARAGKPRREGFYRAAGLLGLRGSQLAMVGDQIFTDVYGANRSGIRSLLVMSTDTDLWYQPLRRAFELPFMREKKERIR